MQGKCKCDKQHGNNRYNSYNSTQIQLTPPTSTVTLSNMSINEIESTKSKTKRNNTNPGKISTEHKNKVKFFGQDGIQKYPDKNSTLVNKILQNIFGYVMVLCLTNVHRKPRKYRKYRKYLLLLLFTECYLVAILKYVSCYISK